MELDHPTSAIIYGLPGAGKSSVASVVAAVQAGQHIEMSTCARMIYSESGSRCSTFEEFVRDELWHRSDFARVARRAATAWLGGPVLVSGPRREEELAELMRSFGTERVLRVVVDEHTRIRRAAASGQLPETAVARAAEESTWGLVGRRTPEAVDITNRHSLSAAVWTSIHSITDTPFQFRSEDCADNLEYEMRYQVFPPTGISDRLGVVGDVTRESIVDDWYIPSRIQTRSQHDVWLASGLCGPVRVRRDSHGARLTIKSPPTVHGVAQELTLRGDSAVEKESTEAIQRLGLRRAVQLKKLRHKTSLPSQGIMLCFDEYEDGTSCLEVEFQRTDPSFGATVSTLDHSAWRNYFQGVDLRPARPIPLRAVEQSLDNT